MIFIIPGRFQPFHKGHLYIVKTIAKSTDPSDEVVVQFVHPGDDRLNERRPFPIKVVRKAIIASLGPLKNNVHIIRSKTLWFDDTLEELGYSPPEEYYNDVVICVGEDRAQQLKSASKKYGFNVFDFSRNGITKSYSATAVRAALAAGDYREYHKLVAKGIATKKWFELLREYVLQWAE